MRWLTLACPKLHQAIRLTGVGVEVHRDSEMSVRHVHC